MANIILALPKLEDAKVIKNILLRSGFRVNALCTTGAQAISQADTLHDGIVVSSYKLSDMIYSELKECLPSGFEMLLMASAKHLDECLGNDIVCLQMPLKTNDLINTLNMMSEGIERRRRRQKNQPRVRNEKEDALIKLAKETLMARNNMTEQEAHKYLQKCSMDSGTNMAETAEMVLVCMNG